MFKHVAQLIQSNVSDRKQQEQEFFAAVNSGDLHSIDKLIQAGLNPNVRDNDGFSALQIAAEKGDVGVGRYLVAQKKININKNVDPRTGNTALMTAVTFNRIQFMSLLLRNGADPNIQNAFEKTALHIAVTKSSSIMVKTLLVSKADPNVVDAFDNTPLSLSMIEFPSFHIADTLMKYGADPNLRTTRANPLLLEIALNGRRASDVRMAKLLIENGADVNIRNLISQQTALHIVSINGYMPMAKFLLKSGANYTLKDISGRTPIDVAIEHEQLNLIALYKDFRHKVAKDIMKSISSVEEGQHAKNSIISKKKSAMMIDSRTVRFSETKSKESGVDVLSIISDDD